MKRLLAGAAFLVAANLLAALPAAAASFHDGNWGFESAGLEGLDSFTIDDSDPFLMAGEVGAGAFAVELTGSTDICLFTDSNPTCRPGVGGVTGPYSVFVTVEITAVNSTEIDGPFTLFLTGLGAAGYTPSEVTIDLASTVPAGLDTSGIAGFNPSAFVHIIDETFAPGTIYDYIGWTVQLGDTVSFRYDVLTGANGRSVPQLTANVVPRVIPEPGTAVLLGLGLATLASRNRRLA